jgi:sulfopropanediol 3-dehydrogenase
VAESSWGQNGKVYVAENPEEAVQISDEYAPEHLELQVQDTDFYLARLSNYGSLFIGEETTVAYGDKPSEPIISCPPAGRPVIPEVCGRASS